MLPDGRRCRGEDILWIGGQNLTDPPVTHARVVREMTESSDDRARRV